MPNRLGQMYRSVFRGEAQGRLLVLGDGPLAAVRLEETGRRFELGPERQAQADVACARLRAGGQTVENDPVYRLAEHQVGEKLIFRVDRGDYSQVVGTKSHPEWGVKAQVLAICCAVECPQGFVIEKRSERVAAAPGLWHLAPAGSLQPPNDVFSTVLAEAEEELGLTARELREPRCVGLVYVETAGVYLVACSARTEVSLETIQGRARSGAWEQVGLTFVPADPEALPRWLAETPLLLPAARAVLWAEGLRRWGRDWFETHCEDSP